MFAALWSRNMLFLLSFTLGGVPALWLWITGFKKFMREHFNSRGIGFFKTRDPLFNPKGTAGRSGRGDSYISPKEMSRQWCSNRFSSLINISLFPSAALYSDKIGMNERKRKRRTTIRYQPCELKMQTVSHSDVGFHVAHPPASLFHLSPPQPRS